jgi:hypothetical protein
MFGIEQSKTEKGGRGLNKQPKWQADECIEYIRLASIAGLYIALTYYVSELRGKAVKKAGGRRLKSV